MKDTKGVVVYLLVAYGVYFAVLLSLCGLGLLPMSGQNIFQKTVMYALLFTPALAAIIARRVEGDEGTPKLWPLPWGKALRIALVVFALFALQNVIAVVSGFADADPAMRTLSASVLNMVPNAPPVVMTLIPVLGYTFVPITSLLFGMTLCALFALGGEYGWRAYLQPRLDLAMGKLRGTVAGGIAWTLWWMPLVYFGFQERTSIESFAQLAPRVILVLILLGSISASIHRRTGHVALSAIFLGCVYSQFFGLWDFLLQQPMYPWSGDFGVIAIIFWLLAALAPWIFVGKEKTGEDADD